jgi:hypothetical protein
MHPQVRIWRENGSGQNARASVPGMGMDLSYEKK